MSKISKEVIQEWAKKKSHIRDRLNRIKKRLKKYSKQEKHFELRLRLIQQYEKEIKSNNSN
jgi:pyruvate-formate lyase-activating enzyme